MWHAFRRGLEAARVVPYEARLTRTASVFDLGEVRTLLCLVGGGALLLLLSPRTRLAEMGPRHLRSRVGCSAILNNRAAAAGGVGRDFPVSMLKMT